jgi:NADPH:quinone reductase-like Zn-dependent oxidoreductase
MRAVSQTTFGGPEVLQITEVDQPTNLATEVLVEVRASGVNPIDGVVRSGAYPMLGEPPFILGWDISGVVAAVNPGVHRFQVGDEVYGMPFLPRQGGGYAEYVSVPSRQLGPKPRTLDHVHAAALPLVGLTAWQALVDIADVQPGQRVLIHAGGGGLGHIAIQLAKHLGAEVITTASESKHEFVRDLGADQVIDYRTVDFTTVVSDVDVVLEVVGGDYADRSVQVLKPGGLLVTAVQRADPELAARTVAAGRRFAGVGVESDGYELERLAELVDSGALRVHVEQTFPLEQAAKAHEMLTSGPRGKLVLTL